nr:MBL fold metallo-hydrolase [uncultured Sphaerochaeta sp.]
MQVDILGYSGSIQTETSTNTSLIVRSETTSILVDTSGSPVQVMLQTGVDPTQLDAVLLTHAHVDHLYALPSLLHNLWMLKRTKPLVIVGSPATLDVAKNLIRVFQLNTKDSLSSIIHWVTQPQRIGDIDIQSFAVYHRPATPTQGYTFIHADSKVSYFPDSAVQKPYPSCSYNSDLIIHEVGGLGKDRDLLHREGHSAANEVAQLVKEVGARKLLLVHLPPDRVLREEILREALTFFPNTVMPEGIDTYSI